MTEQPIDTFAADYVLGNLTIAEKVMLEAHMEIVPETRQWVSRLQDACGLAFEELDPVALDEAGAMLERIVKTSEASSTREAHFKSFHAEPSKEVETGSEASILPESLRRYLGYDFDQIPWQKALPGTSIFRPENENGYDVYLLRMKPGRALPTHTHAGTELSLVLKGSFSDSLGTYRRGDIAFADEGVDHRPIVARDDECVCFIINKRPVRFKSRLVNLVLSLCHN